MKVKELRERLDEICDLKGMEEWEVRIETKTGWNDITSVFVIDENEVGLEMEED